MIAERIAAWQEIARRLAHEIKNPLTPIQMAMDTLRKSWKKQHPVVRRDPRGVDARPCSRRPIASSTSSPSSPTSRACRSPSFARSISTTSSARALALYQGAAPVEIAARRRSAELDADKDQLTQVLLNLVENARDAIGKRDGGKIVVTTKRGDAGDRALLVVEDNGPGVPGELKDKVFAPYFTTKHAQGRHRAWPRDRPSHRLRSRRPHHDHRCARRRRAVRDRAAAAQRHRAARFADLATSCTRSLIVSDPRRHRRDSAARASCRT